MLPSRPLSPHALPHPHPSARVIGRQHRNVDRQSYSLPGSVCALIHRSPDPDPDPDSDCSAQSALIGLLSLLSVLLEARRFQPTHHLRAGLRN